MNQLIKPENKEENYYSHLLKYKRALRKQTAISAMVNAVMFSISQAHRKLAPSFWDLRDSECRSFLALLSDSLKRKRFILSLPNMNRG